ncbi:MAG: hypothetical protein WC901_05440 [Candidatus Margulisiibacteriota bacterium]
MVEVNTVKNQIMPRLPTLQGKPLAEDQATVTREELEKGQVPAPIVSEVMSYDKEGDGLDADQLTAALNAQAAANFTIYDINGMPVAEIINGAVTVSELPTPPADPNRPSLEEESADTTPPKGTSIPDKTDKPPEKKGVVRPQSKWENLVTLVTGAFNITGFGNIPEVTGESPDSLTNRLVKKYDKDNDSKVSERELVRLLRDMGYRGANRKVVEALIGDYDGTLESDDNIPLTDVFKILLGKSKDLMVEGKSLSVWITLRLEKVDNQETAAWVRAQYDAGSNGTLRSALESSRYNKNVLELADTRFKLDHPAAKAADYKKSDEYWQYVATLLMERLFDTVKETYKGKKPIQWLIFGRIRWDNPQVIQEFCTENSLPDNGKNLLVQFVKDKYVPSRKELLYLMQVSRGRKAVAVKSKPEPEKKTEPNPVVIPPGE